MKKIACFVLIACMLMFLPGCDFLSLKTKPTEPVIESDSVPVQSDSGTQAPINTDETAGFKSYNGIYTADGSEIDLTVFDVDTKEGVFFEIGLIEEWIISGVAKLTGNTALFQHTDSLSGKNEIEMTFEEDGKITLNILRMQENFEHNSGVYKMIRTGDVPKDNTFCDARLRLNDHAIFTEFVNRDFPGSVTQWEYLGHTKGEVGIVGYETYNVASTDLYRLSVDGEVTYYAVWIANRMDEDEFGVCEFVDGELTDFMFVKMMQY